MRKKMEFSKLELKVIEAIIKDNPEERVIRDQLNSSTVTSRDNTGAGLYTEIRVSAKCRQLQTQNRHIEEQQQVHITHPALKAGAGAILWLKGGYISTLECYTYEEHWPKDESLFNVNA